MTDRATHSEAARKTVHIAMGGFALLLRWLTWPEAVALAGAALVFNRFVLPGLGRRLYRPGDRPAGRHGIVYYPLSVLILLLLFPGRPDIVAAAWAILAAGDGVATLAGKAIGGPRWPWTADKTIAGSIAFMVAGSLAGIALACWCRDASALPGPPVPLGFALFVPPVAALVAALVETIPVTLDDNLSVALSSGGVLWLGALICSRYPAAWTLGPAGEPSTFQTFSQIAFPMTFLLAVGANAAVAIAGCAARTVSVAGAVCGACIGIAIFDSLGWQGWLLLLVTFIAASVASRAGLTRKERLGIAEDRGGRRGPGNALANTGVAAIAAVLAGLDVHPALSRAAFAAALTAGGSDTIASEIGKAFGRTTVSVTSLRRVRPGTSGAMSLEGTAAGLVGAVGLALVAAWLSIVPLTAVAAIVIGATAGSLLESWLGATLEGPGVLNNDLLNFINTGAAAAFAVALVRWLT